MKKAQLRPRMGFVIYIFDSVLCYGKIYLRRHNVLVTKQLLKGFQIGSVLHHVYGKRGSEDMGRNPT